jgi:hypothetical protein
MGWLVVGFAAAAAFGLGYAVGYYNNKGEKKTQAPK